nr:unnamed protein product [Digitaria exilis]
MSSWVLDVERALAEHSDASSESSSRWQRHCIYRVPACIKNHNPKAYKPQVVSLGPFHHGDAELVPMEDHKRRALRHLLRRSGRPLEAFAAAVEEVAEQLEDAYQDLDAEWRAGDEGGRERFMEMLVIDGCFLLELMMVAGAGEDEGRSSGGGGGGYAPNDPVFSRHGMLYMVPFIRRDMLMLENQLPLLSHDEIKRMVLRFVSPSSRPTPDGDELGLHPLAIYHGSLGHGPYRVSRRHDVPDTGGAEIIRPATELHEAGIKFKKSWTDSLHDVRFFRRGGVLSVPAMSVDDSTEYALLNAMAFERLHAGVAAGAGNDVAAYVFFMGKLLDSARDVALLGSMGIVQNAAGSDEAVAKLFERMSKDMVLDPSETELDAVHRQVNAYCRRRRPWRMCGGGGGARQSRSDAWLRTPWVLFAIIVLLVMVIVQTIYIVLQFYELRHR